MDYLQEAKTFLARSHIKQAEKPLSQLAQYDLNTASIYAQLAQVEALQSIAVSLAALVELSTGTLTDTVGDGDFTDGLDAEMEVPF